MQIYIKYIVNFTIIYMCALRCSAANNASPDFKLVYNNSAPDAIEFSVKSIDNRFFINAVKCGKSVYLADVGRVEQTARVTGLTPCKTFECTVEVKNRYSYEKSVHIQNITTGFRNDTPPIKILNILPESNLFRINLDFEQIECINSFFVVRNNSKSIYWTKYNLTKSIEISDLSPCINYHMFIIYNHQLGPYTIFYGNMRTSPLKLRQIDQIEFEPTSEMLSWASVYLDDCTSKYVITIAPETDGQTLFFESEQNQLHLNFLDGCSKFFIYIKPKGHDALSGTYHLETKYKSPQNAVQNITARMMEETALMIKWSRPAEHPACVLQYAVQINGLWSITPSLEHVLPVCKISQPLSISVCVVAMPLAINCVNYKFDVNLNKLIGPLSQTDYMRFPPLYRLKGWGSITMYDVNDINAILLIKDQISTLPNSTFTLAISELNCGANLVPSYKIYDANNENDKCTYLVPDECTKLCEFKTIPNEIQFNVTDGLSFNCISADHQYVTLKRGVRYEIMGRIFRPHEYTDTVPIVFPQDVVLASKPDTIFYISIPVVCIVLLLIIVVIGVHCKRRNETVVDRTFIEVEHFYSFYRNIDRDFIKSELQSIDDIDLSRLTKTGHEKMLYKNRQNNIIPYDYNRVDLTTGYINASYIKGYNHEKRYIATQGPTEATIEDFWQLVIEQKCDEIVMLTQLTENDKVQCCQYYPNLDETLELNNVSVTNVEETNFECFIKRIVQIQSDEVDRNLIHYQYISWPNGGFPEGTFDLIDFVENTGGLTSKSLHPILIHSSLGTGRAGTFIALDLLFHQLHNEQFISVCDTVKKLRRQRCRMVETVDQYEFLYACVYLYYFNSILKQKNFST